MVIVVAMVEAAQVAVVEAVRVRLVQMRQMRTEAVMVAMAIKQALLVQRLITQGVAVEVVNHHNPIHRAV
jgi:hypothetical protein